MMSDDETTEVESTGSAPDVEVDNTTVEAPDAVVEASPTIVVESGSDDAGATPEEVERAVNAALSLERLQQQVDELWSAVVALQGSVEAQEVVQEAVVDTVVEQAEEQDALEDAVTEEVAESLAEEGDDSFIPDALEQDDPDEPPTTARKHWMFRSRADWRKK